MFGIETFGVCHSFTDDAFDYTVAFDGSSHSDLDAIFVPVGGGGLIAGIAAYIKAVLPAVKVIGFSRFGTLATRS